MKQHIQKSIIIMSLFLIALTLHGCATDSSSSSPDQPEQSAEKVFNYGTMAYGVAMGNAGLNPHDGYSGWSAIRYGVGETLFKFNASLELEPWIAESYEQVDPYTVKIQLRDNVTFSNGKKVTGEAVKACFDDLIQVHDRAPHDLQIKSITADDQTVTIVSENKVPALINYLCDPYGAIIDVEAQTEGKNVVGTGPFMATDVSDTEIHLVSNPNYWNGETHVDAINVLSITDGDTLTMALQNGEIDAAQGLPYASLQLFENDKAYKISSNNTSRVYQAAINFHSEILKDDAVRSALSQCIDKSGFTKVLLQGNGIAAKGPFPANLPFGGTEVNSLSYDPENAKALLDAAGWIDTDGDGIRDKDGKPLSIDWLTYTSRQELPLLAESVQATGKAVGIDIRVNATDNYKDFLKKDQYDVFANAFVSAPTGDPQYYFTTHVLQNSDYNRGHYYSEDVETLVQQLQDTFDPDLRKNLAIQISQDILDDHAYIYVSHLKMSFVMKQNVEGFSAHPSDYYEITADLELTN